jgi:carboxylesterase
VAGQRASSEPFDLVGDDEIGVVLVHGFTGTPYEVGYLGAKLAAAGYTVRAPRLPGHGTTLADLDATTWEDWAAAVERAVDALRVRCRHVAVVGQSLGGLLALHVASHRRDVCAVASLAAPLWLDGLNGKVAHWTRPGGWLSRVTKLPKLGGSDVRDPRSKAENPCYDGVPTRALAQLVTFMKITDEALPNITQPVLVLHATQDHTAPVACAQRIAERAHAKRVRILPRSYHLIAVDVERDIVAAEVVEFLRTCGDKPCAT